MIVCDNGRRALDWSECHKWVIPGTRRHFVMARAAAGFVLADFATWYHENIEPIDGGQWDDWSFAFRPIRGTTDTVSNHAGWAIDLNATKHPLGTPVSATFTAAQAAAIRRRLRYYGGVIRWGGDYHGRPDSMHFEIVGGVRAVLAAAYLLKYTPRGRRIRRANPGGGW